MLESQMANCYDCVGAMLMLVVVDQDVSIMNKRGITSLDPYLARSTKCILSRLLYLLDTNINSLKVARPSDFGSLDLRPHYVLALRMNRASLQILHTPSQVTRKYAELAVAMNVLCPKLVNPAHATRVRNKMKVS